MYLSEQKYPVQNRVVQTPLGTLTYTLVRKRVKRLNLRVNREGSVTLSVPQRCSAAEADRLVLDKCEWIMAALARQREQRPLLPERPRTEQYDLLAQALARMYLLVAPLGVPLPQLKIRTMRSQWGNCHWAQGYITLNTALTRCPEALRDYVALHELVHFLHHDHGAGFYGTMDALMPDWRERRRELKAYGAALEKNRDG